MLSFAEDVAYSGGYWPALAGDEIFMDLHSTIGAIGAAYGTFGMRKLLKN